MTYGWYHDDEQMYKKRVKKMEQIEARTNHSIIYMFSNISNWNNMTYAHLLKDFSIK